MTQADILYFFPQLCRNQESIFNSENCRHITLLGSRTGDLRMVDGIKWVGFQQADEDAVSAQNLYLSISVYKIYLGSISPNIQIGWRSIPRWSISSFLQFFPISRIQWIIRTCWSTHPMGTNRSPSRVRCPCSRYPSRVWRTSRVNVMPSHNMCV